MTCRGRERRAKHVNSWRTWTAAASLAISSASAGNSGRMCAGWGRPLRRRSQRRHRRRRGGRRPDRLRLGHHSRRRVPDGQRQDEGQAGLFYETPQHTLYLPEYRIARVPVTVAQFAKFVRRPATRLPPSSRGRYGGSGAPTGRTRAGRRAMCGRSRIIPSPASRGMTPSPSANGPVCAFLPRRNGRRSPRDRRSDLAVGE